MSFWDAFGRSFGSSVQSGSAAGANLVAQRIAADRRRQFQLEDAETKREQQLDDQEMQRLNQAYTNAKTPEEVRVLGQRLGMGPDAIDARANMLQQDLIDKREPTQIKRATAAIMGGGIPAGGEALPSLQADYFREDGTRGSLANDLAGRFGVGGPGSSAELSDQYSRDVLNQAGVEANKQQMEMDRLAATDEYNAWLRSIGKEDREHTLTQRKWDKAKNLGGTDGIDFLVSEGLISEKEGARRNNKLRQKNAVEQLELDFAQQSYLNQRLRTREEIFQAEHRLKVLRTELGTAKKVGERTLWFDRDLTDEESTKVADMQAAIENQEAIIREAKASLGDIPAGGGTPAAGGTPGDGSDIRGKILNDQGDGAGEPPPSPAENGAAAAILGKLGSADLDIVPEPRDASAYEPKPWVQAGTTPVDLLIGAGKAFVGDEEQKELERDIARHELWRHSRRTAGPKRITYGGGQARNPNVPGAAAGAVSGDPRPVIPLAFENPDSVPEDIDPQYASIPSRFMRPGIPETMTDATDQPVDLDVNYLDIVSRLMRPGIPLAAHQEGELPEDVSISQADLPMEGRQFGPPEPRPSVPISMDSGGDLLPDDIQLAYVDMGLDQMRPEIAFQLRDFDPQPVDSKISDVDLPLPTMAVDMLKETEEVVPGSLLSDGTSLVALDVLQKHSKPNGKIQVIIDLNTNSATVMRGHELVTQYPVASGDITGTVQGKPTYTPSGETQIYTESPYDTYEQSGRDNYGPYWMSLYDQSKPKAGQHFAGIGMHGPYYEDKKVFDEEGNFLNEGRLSAGCIRFKVEDLIDLSNHVETGTRVFIMPLRGENGTDTRTARAGDTPADGPAPQAR